MDGEKQIIVYDCSVFSSDSIFINIPKIQVYGCVFFFNVFLRFRFNTHHFTNIQGISIDLPKSLSLFMRFEKNLHIQIDNSCVCM